VYWIKKNGIILTITAIIIILVLTLPIKIPNEINTEAKIIPAREWILQKSEDGSIQVIDKDHRKNIVHNMSAYQVVRGDFVEFQMNDELANRDRINKNDFVGRIKSIETERQLASLKRDLSEAESYLQISKTGEKETAIQLAQEIVKKSQIQLENQTKIAERKRTLFEKKIISEEEYEIEKNLADLYKYELLEAQANLADLRAGAKPEEIALYRQMVSTTEAEIQRIKDLMDKFTLKSPINGRIFRVFSNDTLLIIGDTLSVAIIPVQAKNLSEIKIGQKFTINEEMHTNGIKPSGEIININKTADYLNQKVTIMLTGLINESMENVPSHTILPCTIVTEPIVLRDYIFNFIKIIFS